MIDNSAFEDYSKFEDELKYHNRFFVDPKFVELIKETINLNENVLNKGIKLYRARIHKSEDDKKSTFNNRQMFNPEPEKAIRGRSNPDGISYLYLSSDIDTCIKEVSPKFYDIITIGEFKLKSNIRIVNYVVSFPPSQNNYITSLNHCIRLTFSRYQISARPEIEYLPYQFICELIKNENYDGVLYNSSFDLNPLTDSFNLVLFNANLVELDDSNCLLIKIMSTEYKYEKMD